MKLKAPSVVAALLLLCASLGHVAGQGIRLPTSGGVGASIGFGGFGGLLQGGGSGGASSSAGSGSFQSIQMCQRLTPLRDAVVVSADIACKGQNKCQVCGGPDKVRDACAATPSCVAFSYQPSTQCGYLKSKVGARNVLPQQRDWVSYAGGGLFPKDGVSAASFLDLCVMLRPLVNKNVQGFDLQCGGRATCEVCGTLARIRGFCINSANCKGFTWNPARNCGFLKQETTQGLSNQQGWITYSRA